MDITGKVIQVLPTESGVSKNGTSWQKRNFVVEMPGQYTRKICFQLFGDKVNECPDSGDEVKVLFDIDSREYNGRWYTQLNAWKVERQGVQETPRQATPQAQTTAQSDDQLPF